MLALALVYELVLVFLLFQNKSDARLWLKNIDSSLGVPLPERSYAENCELSWNNIYAIDYNGFYLRAKWISLLLPTLWDGTLRLYCCVTIGFAGSCQ
jgi:hypothetical protein